MILNGVTNSESDGKLVSSDEHEDAFDWAHTRKQFQPGEGLLILEAQERLMTFLVNCCKQLLHDIPVEDLTKDVKFPVVPEPQRKSEVEVNGFESLAILVAEAPYRVPAEIDLGRIESLLAARLSAAEDHLWALREDPGYFLDTLLEIKEHRQEQCLDPNGKQHPIFTKPYANMLWSRCISAMLTTSIHELELFSQPRNHEFSAPSTPRPYPSRRPCQRSISMLYSNSVVSSQTPPKGPRRDWHEASLPSLLFVTGRFVSTGKILWLQSQ